MADCRAGHTEVRSIGGLRARLARLNGCHEARQALDDALREWRETKGAPRSDIEILLRLLGLVAQHRRPDGTRRVVLAEQIDNATPYPRAYLPGQCSLSEALHLIEAAGFDQQPEPPLSSAQMEAEIAKCVEAVRGIDTQSPQGACNTNANTSKTTLTLKGRGRGDRGQ